MEQMGFQINTEIDISGKKVKKPKNRKKAALIIVSIILVLVAVLAAAASFIPLKTVVSIENCVINKQDGNSEKIIYDNNGKIQKVVHSYIDIENAVTTYIYGANGLLLMEEKKYVMGGIEQKKYIYSDKRLMKTQNVDNTGKIISYTENFYNADGTLTMDIMYTGEGQPLVQNNYTYSEGKVISKLEFYPQENLQIKIEYTYQNGNIVSEKHISPTNEKTVTYTYDNQNNVLTKNSSDGQYLIYTYQYKEKKVPFGLKVKG